MSLRDMGTSMLAVGGFVVVADLLDVANYWQVGLGLWLVGVVLYFAPGGDR